MELLRYTNALIFAWIGCVGRGKMHCCPEKETAPPKTPPVKKKIYRPDV